MSANSCPIPIVIVNWNGSTDTIECLQSLSKLNNNNWNAIVVDNNSSPQDANTLKAYCQNPRNITLLLNESNLGFARANNQALTYLRYNNILPEYVALLNNDTVADSNWLDEILAHAKKTKSDLVSSKMIQYGNRQLVDNIGHFMLNTGEILPEAHGEHISRFSSTKENIGACAGACLIKREVIEHLGLFDEFFSTGYEDAEFGLRVVLSGYKCTYAPDAVIYHKSGQSINKIFNENFAIRTQINVLYTYFKLIPTINLAYNLPVIILRYLLISLLFGITGKWRYTRIIYLAVWRFIKNDLAIAKKKRKEFYDLVKDRSLAKIHSKWTNVIVFDIKRLWKFIFMGKVSAFDRN